jgi:hypothetical protein
MFCTKPNKLSKTQPGTEPNHPKILPLLDFRPVRAAGGFSWIKPTTRTSNENPIATNLAFQLSEIQFFKNLPTSAARIYPVQTAPA